MFVLAFYVRSYFLLFISSVDVWISTFIGVSSGVARRVAGDDVEHAGRSGRGDLDLFRCAPRSRERSPCLGQYPPHTVLPINRAVSMLADY